MISCSFWSERSQYSSTSYHIYCAPLICITGGQEGTLQEYLLICQRPKMQMLAEYEHITDRYWLFPVAWPNFSQLLDLGEKASQNLSHQKSSWLNQWLQGRILPFNHQTVYDDLVCLFIVKVALCIMSKPFHFCLVCFNSLVVCFDETSQA